MVMENTKDQFDYIVPVYSETMEPFEDFLMIIPKSEMMKNICLGDKFEQGTFVDMPFIIETLPFLMLLTFDHNGIPFGLSNEQHTFDYLNQVDG